MNDEIDPASRGFDSGGPTLAAVGEAELVQRLLAIARTGNAGGLVLGGGDDAALWRLPEGAGVLAVSQDAVVEGVDFARAWTTPCKVGHKAAAVALSDMAGMGARPVWCTATLCAPPSTSLEDVLGIQRGLTAVTAAAGCSLAGGDVSAIDGPLVIDVCVAGTLAPDTGLRRDQGRPGDLLLVSGVLGRAAAGLRLLASGRGEHERFTEAMQQWIDAQREPNPRLREGLELVDHGVACGCDISDGLLVDAGHIARASGCGAQLWLAQLPVDAQLEQVFPAEWQELALAGGEDFELLVAAPEDAAAALLESWPHDLAPLRTVGRLVPSAGIRLLDRAGGVELALPQPRSLHFGLGGG